MAPSVSCSTACKPCRSVVPCNVRHSRRARATTQVRASAVPHFVPPAATDIQEPGALEMIRRMKRTSLPVPSLGNRLFDTAYVGPTGPDAEQTSSSPAIVLLHGFDSSCLEYRRLHPLLNKIAPTYALDLVGWGFTCSRQFSSEPDLALSPTDKWQHLEAFWQKVLGGRPMVLVGASLGGAIAMDFYLHRPEAVSQLVLINPQGFIDGIGPMASLPRPAAALGVKLLQWEGLRQAANVMAYHNKDWATVDALRIGRLHTLMPGWLDANVAFMKSGGYKLSKMISKVDAPVLLLWGRQDEILDPATANRYVDTLPSCQLHWVEECGHVPHLEQPVVVTRRIAEALGLDLDTLDQLMPAAVGATA